MEDCLPIVEEYHRPRPGLVMKMTEPRQGRLPQAVQRCPGYNATAGSPRSLRGRRSSDHEVHPRGPRLVDAGDASGIIALYQR